MEQLLSISSVPIQIEIIVNKAQFNYNTELPKVDVTRNKGGLVMQAEPIQMDIDYTKSNNSIGLKKIDALTKDYVNKSWRICYQGLARISQEGRMLGDAKNFSPADIAAQRNMRSVETILSFLPKDGPEISWTGGTLSINYQADDLNFNWDTNIDPNFEFIPGSVEFHVKSMPDVNIEYIGRPVYCPPSADPQFDESELDIKA